MNFEEKIHYDDFILLEEALPILIKLTGIRVYDFDYRRFFNVNSINQMPDISVVARTGAFLEYKRDYDLLIEYGIRLIHTPEVHEICSKLPKWYPLISDMTPKSFVFDDLPNSKEIENKLGWPIFVKGERQTSKHRKSLSIINSPTQFDQLKKIWKIDPILSWKKMVCREYIELQTVEESLSDSINCSYEFRLFFWKNNFVGLGPYWFESKEYVLENKDKLKVINIGAEAARRVNATFLSVDIALTKSGEWIVIEINDGQESGFVGCNPFVLWTNILEIEKDANKKIQHT